MKDIKAIEKALLIGIVREQNWNVIIYNDIKRDYFSYENRALYDYIEKYTKVNKYPDLPLLQYEFQIPDDEMMELANIGELDNLCKTLANDYFKHRIEYELQELNEDINKGAIEENPLEFVHKMTQAVSSLEILGSENQSVGLFDNIEEILKIDPNDVISTGFKELDEKLIGFKRGEELITIVGRTGQGKTWIGLKFAWAASLRGERVGIYSGEMSVQQLQERIICCAKQTYTSTKEEALKFILDNKPDIRILTQADLRRKANIRDIENFIVKNNLTMLVVDQLSLMDDITSRPGTPLRQQYGNISMDLFTLTSKYNLPCVLLAQSNRQGGQELNAPGLENIAESDAVAQNSTRVISMRNENGILTLSIVKNRYGESGLTQKYEVDYGINKYKPVRELQQEVLTSRKAKARQIFGGGGASF